MYSLRKGLLLALLCIILLAAVRYIPTLQASDGRLAALAVDSQKQEQQPPPQSGRGGAYRPFDAPMDGYPGAERPPRPQPPPQQTPRRRGSDNGGCAIS